MWCKQSTRKHKKWEGDAFLIAKPPTSRLVILKDPEGKEIGRGSGLAISKVQELEAGSTISFRSGHLLHSVVKSVNQCKRVCFLQTHYQCLHQSLEQYPTAFVISNVPETMQDARLGAFEGPLSAKKLFNKRETRELLKGTKDHNFLLG